MVPTFNTLARMPITLDETVGRVEGCISANLSGSAAILHPESGLYFGINEVGATIWNLLIEPRTGHDLLAHLLGHYEVDRETCRADLLGLLGRLAEHNLIKVHPRLDGHAPTPAL